MKRLGLFLFSFVVMASTVACGGGSGGGNAEQDMSTNCGAVTCSATMYYNAKTCSCDPADLSPPSGDQATP